MPFPANSTCSSSVSHSLQVETGSKMVVRVFNDPRKLHSLQHTCSQLHFSLLNRGHSRSQMNAHQQELRLRHVARPSASGPALSGPLSCNISILLYFLSFSSIYLSQSLGSAVPFRRHGSPSPFSRPCSARASFSMQILFPHFSILYVSGCLL